MPSLRTSFLILASIALLIVLGGGIYEHVAVVPQWSAAPPLSLSMFQGEYGLNPGPFWRSIHPVAILLLIGALITNWRSARRNMIAIAFGGYLLMLVTTAIYFVPELIEITSTPYAETVDEELVGRAGTWETLSIGRAIFLTGLAAVLLTALTRPAPTESAKV